MILLPRRDGLFDVAANVATWKPMAYGRRKKKERIPNASHVMRKPIVMSGITMASGILSQKRSVFRVEAMWSLAPCMEFSRDE